MPAGWWERLSESLQRSNFANLEDFCRDTRENTPSISSKTIYRARKSGVMTLTSLRLLAKKLHFETYQDLLAEWSHSFSDRVVTNLDSTESGERDRRYLALSRDGLYDASVKLALCSLSQAELLKNMRMMAHWSDRAADAYRTIGRLHEASSYYGRAWSYVQEALLETPTDFDLRYQSLKTKFGQIMVDDYLVRNAFPEAYSRQTRLLQEADSLFAVAPIHLRSEIRVRRIHIKRQQSEMLRYMGRYERALKLIREVLTEYPSSAYEPIYYARLSEADSLRLLGFDSTALSIYSDLEQIAFDRELSGLLGSVLWRKSCVFQSMNLEDERKDCLERLETLSAKNVVRYRFMTIYMLLAQASGCVADEAIAKGHLRKVKSFGPVTPNYLTGEYAHAALCRGELLRKEHRMLEACREFRNAFDCYVQMECRWGTVRAWIGLCLTGGRTALPRKLKRSLEGADKRLLKKFETEGAIPLGILSANIP